MACSSGIDTEKMNAPKLPPKEGKGKLGRFRRTGNWSEKDLEIDKA
jgi:hypothetical protein